ncbi:MAG: M15 family metallopeptidase, partial [Clostridiales bacterium]
MARELILLHPNLQILAKKLEENCLECGLKIRITETLRTKEEQNALYAQGRTKPGNVVTNVKYPNSFHCWGV